MTKLFDGLTYFNETNRAEPTGRKNTYKFLQEEEDIYTVQDLKEKYE